MKMISRSFQFAMLALGLVASPALAAVDGVARLQLQTDIPSGFDLESQDQPRTISGRFYGFGNGNVTLQKRGDGTWQGMLGRYSITTQPAVVTDNGKKATVRILSVPGGIFDYTLTIKTKNAKTSVSISGMGPTGQLTLGGLDKNGRELSVNGTEFLFGVSEDSGKPGYFTGNFLPKQGGFGRIAWLKTAGTLYPASLVSSDTALFLVLYMLPMHEERWPIW